MRPPSRERLTRPEDYGTLGSVKARAPETVDPSPAAAEAEPDGAADASADAAPAAPAKAPPAATALPAAPAVVKPAASLGAPEVAVLAVLALIVLAPMVLGVWWIVSSRADSSNSHAM